MIQQNQLKINISIVEFHRKTTKLLCSSCCFPAGATDTRDLVHGLRGALVHEILKDYVRLLGVDVRVPGILAERRRERILHGSLFIVFIFLYNSLYFYSIPLYVPCQATA